MSYDELNKRIEKMGKRETNVRSIIEGVGITIVILPRKREKLLQTMSAAGANAKKRRRFLASYKRFMEKKGENDVDEVCIQKCPSMSKHVHTFISYIEHTLYCLSPRLARDACPLAKGLTSRDACPLAIGLTSPS